MPIYEYRCKKCDHQFELMRRLAQRDKAPACSNCGSKATRRVQVQRFAVATGAAPDVMAGDGDPEDFLGGDDDFDMDDDFDF